MRKRQMGKVNEARHLCTLECYYNEGMDAFVFSCNDEGRARKITVKGATAQEIAKCFLRSKVKDEVTNPRSARGKTYLEMARAVIDGTDRKNYIWSTDVETFFSECQKLLDKNYSYSEVKERRQRKKEKSMLIRRHPYREVREGYRGQRTLRQSRFQESDNVPAIATVAGVSQNKRITQVQRQDTVLATVQAMGLRCKVNAMHNVVAEVPDMATAGTVLQVIYNQFGVRGSFMVTWDGKGKLYWAPDTPVDKSIALSYARSAGLAPPSPRRYLERRW